MKENDRFGKGKDGVNKHGNSGSIQKKQNSKNKYIKARDHQAMKKFNKTIHQLKKPSNKISYQHIQTSQTLRSKTPSPLRQINITEPTNIISQNKNKKYQKYKDQNFIENLFNSTNIKKNQKKKPTLVQNLIQKIIKQQNIYHQKNKQSQQNNYQKLKQLQDNIKYYQKIILEKDNQIKIINNKINQFQQYTQSFILNVFDIVVIFKKILERQSIFKEKKIGYFVQKKVGLLVQGINYYVDKLKLQGKIRLKSYVLQKQLDQLFDNRDRSLSEYNHFSINDYLISNKIQQYPQQNNKHHRSRSSNPPISRKNECLQILVDIISRRQSIASSRKGQEQKKIVIKSFIGSLQAHQLCLQKNDLISILKKNDNGWWIGIKDGIVGYFPADCVQ